MKLFNRNKLYDVDRSISEDTGEVPLYRSYGVKKKIHPLHIAFNVFLARMLAIAVFILEFAIIFIVGIMLVFYGGILISTVITGTLIFILLNIQTRVLRRRIEFSVKLKRLCKKQGFKLEYKQSFMRSLYWDGDDRLDFILKAGKYTYYVKYFTPKKPLTSVTFLSKNEIAYTKHTRKNIFTTIFSFKEKTRKMTLRFPEYIDEKDKYSIKAVIVNPKPRDIFVKNPEGSIVPTGTGEHIYGYTIFTGKGFLGTIKRNDLKYFDE